MERNISDFDYDFVEIDSHDTKIVFISDEKTDIARPTDIHMHSFYELFYVQHGSVTIKTESVDYKLNSNEALIIPPKTYHHSVPAEDAQKKSVFFTFEKIRSKNEKGLFDKLSNLFHCCSFYKLRDDGNLVLLLEDILVNLKNENCFKDLRVKAKVTDLILHLYDSISPKIVIDSYKSFDKTAYWMYRYEIDRLIDAYYTNDVSLDLLSEKLYVSSQSIKRIITLVYGKTFNELKTELKMRNAKRLLLNTDMQVKDIASETGYSTTRGFLTAFAKYEGTTPTNYRKNIRQQL